jgi:hypothetical protein
MINRADLSPRSGSYAEDEHVAENYRAKMGAKNARGQAHARRGWFEIISDERSLERISSSPEKCAEENSGWIHDTLAQLDQNSISCLDL